MIIRFLCALALVCCFFISSANAYQRWSEEVFLYISEEYGEQAEKRALYLNDLIQKNQSLGDQEKVELVNSTLNHLPWIADQQHWKKADYWATPMETLITFGGDCEDIAIAKFLMLRHLAIPAEKLRLAYVKIKKTGEAHMVLLFLPQSLQSFEKKQVYVLDNYVDEVLLASKRMDLLAVYAFGADGELILFSDDGDKRSVKGVYEERTLRKLDDLKIRMAQDMEKFKTLNGGKYLFDR